MDQAKSETVENSGAGAQSIVAAYVDECRRVGGGRPPGKIVGQAAKQIGKLLDEGIADDVLLAAVKKLAVDGGSPTKLPLMVMTEQRARNVCPECEIGGGYHVDGCSRAGVRAETPVDTVQPPPSAPPTGHVGPDTLKREKPVQGRWWDS